jgi:chemotaxis protein histidine kinase CheA
MTAVAEDRRRAAEERKAATTVAVEERKAAAAAAAEQRLKAAEEKRAVLAATVEEKKANAAAAAEARGKAAEEKKSAIATAAEERRRATEEKKASAAAAAGERRKAAEEKKVAMAAAAEERRKGAAAKVATSAQKPTASKVEQPPRGVPVIKSWKRRRDGTLFLSGFSCVLLYNLTLLRCSTGGVSGRIFGSPSFKDGEVLETSPISKGTIESGSVVMTVSGSRYFLSSENAVKKANIMAAIKDMTAAKPGATITLTKERKGRQAKAATEALKSAKPRATFSLFGLGLGAVDEGLPPPARAPQPATAASAPRGVPIMTRWKKNRDGSITGIISGSKSFKDGEQVTTSIIARGKIARKETVTTGSSSRYFLD